MLEHDHDAVIRSATERTATERTATERTATERAADHAALARSMDELVPTLIAKLGTTGLAELEVREDSLRIRLRRPADAPITDDRRAADRATDRAHRTDRSRGAPGGSPSIHQPGMTPVGPGPGPGPGREPRDSREVRTSGDGHGAIATSPAVGIYHPGPAARAGTRVRAGDRLGTVDMLGVPQEVVAPTDGVVGTSLAEGGDAVEYGQELVAIEFATTATTAAATTAPSATPPDVNTGP